MNTGFGAPDIFNLHCSAAEYNDKLLFNFTDDFHFCIVFANQWYFESRLNFDSVHFNFWYLQLILKIEIRKRYESEKPLLYDKDMELIKILSAQFSKELKGHW